MLPLVRIVLKAMTVPGESQAMIGASAPALRAALNSPGAMYTKLLAITPPWLSKPVVRSTSPRAMARSQLMKALPETVLFAEWFQNKTVGFHRFADPSGVWKFWKRLLLTSQLLPPCTSTPLV